jgi:multiple sugar transport system substrate-binding protein
VIFGCKLHHTAYALFYNKTHFEKAGLTKPPSTLEELIEYTDIINKKLGPSIKGYGFDPRGQYLMPYLTSKETPALVENNKIAIDTPNNRKTLRMLQKFARSGKCFISDPGGSAARQNIRLMFLNQKISMMVSGPWDVANIKKNFPDLPYGVTMIPHLEGVEPLALVVGTGVGIPSMSKHPELAWELIKRLTDVETEVAATLESGMLMPRKTWLKDPRIQNEKTVIYFKDILPLAVDWANGATRLAVPEITWPGAVWQKFYETMVYTSEDIDKALDAYIKEANNLIETKGKK